MVKAVESAEFKAWFAKLRDKRAKARIVVRIQRLLTGHAGDAQPIGHGLSEMRIDYGPGYRVYYQQRGAFLLLLLCAGHKRTQRADIANAKRIAAQWSET